MENKRKPTKSKSKEQAIADRGWFIVDAEDQIVGRLASRIAHYLRGKHRADYTPHVACGDFVIVINAGKARFTGSKAQKKIYHRHTGWVGGIRSATPEALFASKKPEKPLEMAIYGMLPKGPLGREMFSKLKIYASPEHPHKAQKAQPLTFV
jgi:large subunit ribosomal protein L13